eukprot:scaffold1039_cov312-Pavlova_lutheri.AAC.1
MEESDHATRMSTLRRELEQEREERFSLETKIAELQQLIEKLQAHKVEESEEEEEMVVEDGPEGVHLAEPREPSLQEVTPSEQE